MAEVGYTEKNKYLPRGMLVHSSRQLPQGLQIAARTPEPESLGLNPDLAIRLLSVAKEII